MIEEYLNAYSERAIGNPVTRADYATGHDLWHQVLRTVGRGILADLPMED